MDPPLPPFDSDVEQLHEASKIIRFPRTFAREAKRSQIDAAKRSQAEAAQRSRLDEARRSKPEETKSQEPLRAFFQDLQRSAVQHSVHTSAEQALQATEQKPPMVMVEVEMPDSMKTLAGQEMPSRAELVQELRIQSAPRIVYAAEIPPPAEQMELLPSFDDIRLESPVESPQIELEMPLQVAPLNMRGMAGVVDVGIVVAVTAALAIGFTQVMPSAVSAVSPRMAGPCLLAAAGVLWLTFQYLFLVYGRGTPGMVFCDLELITLAGRPASTSSRRIRALACAVSAWSVGLGYLWTLVDEDMLGWHDRMSGTCLKQSALSLQQSADSTQSDIEEGDEMDLPY